LDKTFEGKTVLITGASNGLGRVCAKAFEAKGARLVICGRNQNKLEELLNDFSKPQDHILYAGDLNDYSKVEHLASRCPNNVEIILHAMGGGFGKRETLLGWSDFELLFKSNLGSGAELNRLIIPRMIENGYGRVLHVGSVASEQAVASVGYNTVKAGLAAYVRSLGREVASKGVVVTGILPGGYNAPGNSWERLMAIKPEVVEKFVEEKQPRGKLGSYHEIIPLIEFLCSAQSSMMTGCCVPIDGGEGITYV